MKVVGKRRVREVTVKASGALLAEGARFNDGFADSGLGSTFIPKGIHRFKTLEEADSHRLRCLVEGMGNLAKRRR